MVITRDGLMLLCWSICTYTHTHCLSSVSGCEIDDTTIRLNINAFNSERMRDTQVRFVFNIKRNELCNWVSDFLVGDLFVSEPLLVSYGIQVIC